MNDKNSSEDFIVSLDNVNSAFGISGETLRLLAQANGTTPENIILRALTSWAKTEIPDLDLDEPTLTDAQKLSLLEKKIQREKIAINTPSLAAEFNNLIKKSGEHDGTKSLDPLNGGHS